MSTRALTARRIILAAGGLLLPVLQSHALPTLPGDQFFAPASLFTSTPWTYTGSLPSAVNAGYVAKNIDDPVCPFGICVGGDSQNSSGSRTMTTATGGSSPSYSLSFRGVFDPERFEAWTTNMVSQSKGDKFDPDVDQVQFPAPGGTMVNEHPIPDAWQGLHGYANPTGNNAKFDRTFTPSRKYLDPGEFNCPLAAGGAAIGHCALVGAYFKGGAELHANLQGYGSIENTVAGTQSVTIDTKANRTTTFLVNGASIASGDINGSASTFKLEEEHVNAVDFSFSGSFKTQTFTIGANVKWDGSGETSSFDASYARRVDMPDYEQVVTANSYLVEVRDAPQLTAGIIGTDFYNASVLASAGISAIDAVFLPVYQPLASSRLVVIDASTQNIKSPDLPIPAGGFTNDLPVFLHFLVANKGTIDLILDHLDFSFFEDDILFDDPLATISRDLSFLIHPNSSYAFGAFFNVPASALNNADDFLEGGNLELAGSGSFTFHDIYGSRQRSFDLDLAAPEPESTPLLVLALTLLMIIRRPKHRTAMSGCHLSNMNIGTFVP